MLIRFYIFAFTFCKKHFIINFSLLDSQLSGVIISNGIFEKSRCKCNSAVIMYWFCNYTRFCDMSCFIFDHVCPVGNPLAQDILNLYQEPDGTRRLLNYLLDNLAGTKRGESTLVQLPRLCGVH